MKAARLFRFHLTTMIIVVMVLGVFVGMGCRYEEKIVFDYVPQPRIFEDGKWLEFCGGEREYSVLKYGWPFRCCTWSPMKALSWDLVYLLADIGIAVSIALVIGIGLEFLTARHLATITRNRRPVQLSCDLSGLLPRANLVHFIPNLPRRFDCFGVGRVAVIDESDLVIFAVQ